jgi:cytochrome P450
MRNMLDVDPPDHTRLRSLVQKAFSPRLVEQLRPRVESLAESLLDGLAGREQFDLIREYALPIPTTVIAEILGIPPEERGQFHRWSQAIVAISPSGLGMLLVLPHVWKFLRFIRRTIRSKRAVPADDLLSALAQIEEGGDRLSEDELVAMAFLLLVAGHETTVNLVGNGILALLEYPDELERLRSDPSLIKPAVEELLRFASPVETASERFAREDVTVAGVKIPRGAMVFAAIASANRDAGQFRNPDRLLLDREPNRHLSFGLGPHFCLGAPLARMEGQVAINALLRRAKEFRLTLPAKNLSWRRGLVLRGLKSLPLTVTSWA